MLNQNSNSTCGILYIDDEEKALKYFRMAFAEKFKVFTATSGKEGIEILEREQKNIGIILSDQRMPEMMGAEILGIVRDRFPRIVRILTTAYSDLDSAIQAVNKGHIYQYVVKPWEITDLEMVLHRAAGYYHILSERDELLALKMTTLQRIICGDRLKWLLLCARSWEESTQKNFRIALGTLANAVPDSLNRPVTNDGKYRSNDFEITTLLHAEYGNAAHSLDFLEKTLAGSLSLEASLKAFTAGLAAKFKLAPEQISLSVSSGTAELRVTAGDSPSQEEFARLVFGIFVERKTDALSLLFVAVLVAAAKEQSSLVVAVEARDTRTYQFPLAKGSEDPAEAAIESLGAKFASWDIARM